MKELKLKLLLVCAIVVLFGAPIALGDWDPGDPNKMHHPQLPDPNGWDVNFNADAMFDDWMCSESGYVTDIHFWLSCKGDVWDPQQTGEPCPIARLLVYIHADMPADDPNNEYEFSHPTGPALWSLDMDPFDPNLIRHAGTGQQGWIDWQQDPFPFVIDDDHVHYYQINIEDINNPFFQQEDTIYWLGIHLHTYDDQIWTFGWKSSQDHWNDDAAYFYGGWHEMIDPCTGESMDLAFVITGEKPVPAVKHLNLKWSQPPIEMSQPTILYGSSTWMGTMSLSTVNPNTGLVTIIGPFGTPNSITEIEWSPDGSTLYGTTGGGTSTIHTIDPTTGVVLSTVGQIPAGGALQGLEFNASGTLLGTHVPMGGMPSDLMTVNPVTGVLTMIGPTGFGPIGGLAFDSGFNTLYGITSGLTVPPILLSVNPSTGAAAQIAVTTMNAEASSLEFTADKRLVTAGNDGNFYEINPTTGVATLIGPLVNEPKLSGLSLRPTHPVYWGWDEPSFKGTGIYFPCWDCPTQCHGDADCDGYVGPIDVHILYLAFYTFYGDPAYNHCADFNRDLVVDLMDWLILRDNYDSWPPPDCAPPAFLAGSSADGSPKSGDAAIGSERELTKLAGVGGGGSGYWDLFCVNLTPNAMYWNLVNGGTGGLSDSLVSPDPSGGPVIDNSTPLGGVAYGFGGLDWGNGTLESDVAGYTIQLIGASDYYLSVVLDTKTIQSSDGVYPSWGAISNIVVTPGTPGNWGAPIVPNWVLSPFDPDGGTVLNPGLSSSVTLASNDFGAPEGATQAGNSRGIWGAAAQLPDAPGYKVDFDTNVITWDSYGLGGLPPLPPTTKWQLVADDFRCLGSMPIASIHWWGSHVGWEDPCELPPASELPEAWRIGFWSNMPADVVVPYSYPEQLLWQIEVPADRVDFEMVGTDEFCGIYPYDVAYQYTLYLEPNEYFWQIDYEDVTQDNIFWLSIAAIYPDEISPEFPWGWKTRPWSWMDDAVKFNLYGNLEPGIVLDPATVYIEPIKDPVYYESYDVAFELDTDPTYIKWEQPFTGIRDWPHYEDELSMGTGDNGDPDILRLIADDWRCDGNTPVNAVVWWGSYIGYEYSVGHIEEIPPPMPLPVKPDYFLLNIWTDVPATQHAKWSQKPDLTDINGIDVDAVHWYSDLWGWQVLADDFLCTTTEPITDIYIWGSWLDDELPPGGPNDVEFWVEIFSDNPVGPNGWSVPDDMLRWWDFWPGDFDVWPYAQDLQEGYYSPYTGSYDPISDTNCWLYHFHIDPCDAFIQQGDPCDPNVYWLVIQALPQTSDPNVRFGWKTSTDHHRDDAVWKEWWSGSSEPWIELRYPPGHPFAGQTIDLAFEINPGEGPSYSHPNDIIWEYRAYDYDEVLVGFDKHPLGAPSEPVFRYSVRLPDPNWFLQEDVNDIYWLSVVAVYDANTNMPNYDWGWTNHKHEFNDDAVEGYFDPPSGWFWYELYDQEGQSEDMSFILFTDKECVSCADYNSDGIVNFVDYADFADDWNWNGPAGGYNNSDLNCNGIVDLWDLKIFAEQWLDSCP